ncbi:sensor domain-containing phosphodiesterase [Sphingomonas rubra]|uniref:PAS domain S-box-containing protein/diguanylate cyclase (GGDEF) domain-containing protein n=1 Tax=Sphingomonas rubra TaxID=634430 RepID=A0A1I5TD98_9SPHN|nr:EAL domain-containing protein [Sphingomonas rubra]SFP80667.1 PAS domain S-box-containing protein/diguanylate cyclase (GGDEF) domain-containing protein [Sphingomonas rubra]
MTFTSSLSDAAEMGRLTALWSMAILDTPTQPDFDEVTRLAALALGSESAAVSLVDDRRAWFKSRVCIPDTEAPREHAFCALALESAEPVIILDTHADARCEGNPLTLGPDGFRFYAGAPIITSAGHCLGTLCVLDRQPRAEVRPDQLRALADLAGIVIGLIEARRYRQIGEIATQVVDVTSDAILCVDGKGTITFWNRAAEAMFGYSSAEAVGRSLDIIIPSAHTAAHHRGFARASAGGPTTLVGKSVELTAKRFDDSEFPIELSLARWGSVATGHNFAGIIRDASARKMLEREREQAKAFLDTVVDHLPAMLFVKDAETKRYLLVNRAGEELTGRSRDDMVGKTDLEMFAQGAGYEQRDEAALALQGVHLFESEFERPGGDAVTLRTKRIVVDGPNREREYIVGMSEDVTETRKAQAQVQRLAHYDSLTGLRNRGSFVDEMDKLIAAQAPFALISIDLDRFKAVNDQFGHLAGDAVLAEIGDRLRAVATATTTLARVGGDEFALIVTGAALAERARILAANVVATLASPIVTRWATVQLGSSIGIALAPSDAATTEELRRHADLALYRAKQQGRGIVCFFSAEMDRATQDRRELERDLRAALDSGEITLAYQPVLSASTGQITSVEALARWHHPVRGPIPPDLFISIAEEGGLIAQLGKRILRIACEEAMDWPEHIKVAVNISPMQVHAGDLFKVVRHILTITGLSPRRLQLEVTEGLFLRDIDHTFRELDQLRTLGIQILMDDFGVGYSSLSYFERFRFDKVKIDQSFVRQMLASQASSAIIQAVVGLGTKLGMGVVAEGVETAEQMAALVEAGCTHLQGYLFSKPLRSAEIKACLLANARFVPRPIESALRVVSA